MSTHILYVWIIYLVQCQTKSIDRKTCPLCASEKSLYVFSERTPLIKYPFCGIKKYVFNVQRSRNLANLSVYEFLIQFYYKESSLGKCDQKPFHTVTFFVDPVSLSAFPHPVFCHSAYLRIQQFRNEVCH